MNFLFINLYIYLFTFISFITCNAVRVPEHLEENENVYCCYDDQR